MEMGSYGRLTLFAVLLSLLLLAAACGDLEQLNSEGKRKKDNVGLLEKSHKKNGKKGKEAAKGGGGQNVGDSGGSSGGAEAGAENCTDGYEPCLPPASDYDCAGGTGDGPQYTGTVNVTGPDPYDLDADGDGLGCDS